MLVQLSISFVHVLLLIRDKISGHFSSSKFGFGLVVRGKKRSTFNFTDIKYHATMTTVVWRRGVNRWCRWQLLWVFVVVVVACCYSANYANPYLKYVFWFCSQQSVSDAAYCSQHKQHTDWCAIELFFSLLLLRASCDEWYFATELKSPHRISTNRMFVCSGLIIANIER